jgi:hypothetical protein
MLHVYNDPAALAAFLVLGWLMLAALILTLTKGS